jgi:uncharacterized membrane protein
MAFCTKCGAQFPDQSAFCPKCGAALASGGAASGTPNPGPTQSPTTGIAENVAGLLCYVLGWLTGIIFLLIDKRPSVRFHAAQSIVVFGSLHVIHIILGIAFGASFFVGGMFALGFGALLLHLIGLLTLVLWILLMVKAYQGQRFKLPLAGDIAESLIGKS